MYVKQKPYENFKTYVALLHHGAVAGAQLQREHGPMGALARDKR